jgi:hypothetical protein
MKFNDNGLEKLLNVLKDGFGKNKGISPKERYSSFDDFDSEDLEGTLINITDEDEK